MVKSNKHDKVKVNVQEVQAEPSRITWLEDNVHKLSKIVGDLTTALSSMFSTTKTPRLIIVIHKGDKETTRNGCV